MYESPSVNQQSSYVEKTGAILLTCDMIWAHGFRSDDDDEDDDDDTQQLTRWGRPTTAAAAAAAGDFNQHLM